MRKPTVVLLVIDAMGIGTLEYLLTKFGGSINLPNLTRLGLLSILDKKVHDRIGQTSVRMPGTHAARLNQTSASPDSVIGHREMMGVIDHRTYELFPDGFPHAYIAKLEAIIGRRTMFNQMGGGMEVIERNDEEHQRTGYPIVYASKCDPLIQIAMNEAVISVDEQRRIAHEAFDLARKMKVRITRSIARCYVRLPNGAFKRTANRRDFVLPLPGSTLVDLLRQNGVRVVSVGKPADLVNTIYDQSIHLASRDDIDSALGLRFVHPEGSDTNPYTTQGVVNALAEAALNSAGTFVFGNWVDTDSVFGHTRDVEGALRSLEEIDRVLPLIQERLQDGDLLLITADHGMEHKPDYGYHSIDPVPLLGELVGRGSFSLVPMTSPGFTEVGALVAQMFHLSNEFRRGLIHVRS